jgi:alpha-amylase
MVKIPSSKANKVFAFYREKADNRVVVFLNISRKNVAVKPDLKNISGDYTEYFTGTKITLPLNDSLRIEPWGYKVLIR